jgi:hypothetical protein
MATIEYIVNYPSVKEDEVRASSSVYMAQSLDISLTRNDCLFISKLLKEYVRDNKKELDDSQLVELYALQFQLIHRATTNGK